MLLHTCGAPVSVVEDEVPSITCLLFYCQVCNEVVLDDTTLFVVDGLGLLEEAMKS